jgi:hypothetical protein
MRRDAHMWRVRARPDVHELHGLPGDHQRLLGLDLQLLAGEVRGHRHVRWEALRLHLASGRRER